MLILLDICLDIWSIRLHNPFLYMTQVRQAPCRVALPVLLYLSLEFYANDERNEESVRPNQPPKRPENKRDISTHV